jgi:cobalt-zinc-cadmium efflux system outer membrane protein
LLSDTVPLLGDKASPHGGPLTVENLIAMAWEGNPDLAVAGARAQAARGRLIQAGLYPNPAVGWQAEEVSLNRQSGGQQGPFVAQEIVIGGKLRLAQAAAAHGVTAADWQAIGQWHAINARVRSAYYELLTAQRQIRESEEIVRQNEKTVATAEKIARAGPVLPSDVGRLRVELMLSRNRLGAARQREEAARRLLAAAVGLPQVAGLAVEGWLDHRAPAYDWPTVVASVLSRHSDVQEAQATILQRQHELSLAQAQAIGNLEMRVRPAYDIPDQSMMLFAEAGAPLPIFNRNQGNIMAAHADVGRAAAEARQVELRLVERLTTAFQQYHNAQRQVKLYEEEILPSAGRALEQVRQLFERRGERFFDVLDAQRTLSQARLDYVDALGELWKAVSEIEGLLQREPPACVEH